MTEYTGSKRYQRCQAIFDRAYPSFKNAGIRYQEMVQAVVTSETILLDVGCGRMSLAEMAIQSTQQSLGIDLVHEDALYNDVLDMAAVANAEYLPFADATFDVLVSQWVVEHFPQPRNTFQEMARVLRPGGHLVFLTTNANNYVPLISRLVPDRLQKVVLHCLLRRPTHESFPTFFRANTRRSIKRLSAETGFVVEEIAYAANPFYMAFNVPLFRLAMLYEKITDRKRLNHLKLYLLATLRKTDV